MGQEQRYRRDIAPDTLKTRPMAPPLLQLKDIALTFGGTPLLTGRGAFGVVRRMRGAGRA